MAEAPRPRPVEYYNPRPLILAICFFWGIAMGFCIFYFSPPKQMAGPEKTRESAPPAPVQTAAAKRWEGAPVPADVQISREPVVVAEPAFKTMVIEPPMPALTTEGGLTGRTAQPINRQNLRPLSAPAPARTPAPTFTAPPPIPELMP